MLQDPFGYHHQEDGCSLDKENWHLQRSYLNKSHFKSYQSMIPPLRMVKTTSLYNDFLQVITLSLPLLSNWICGGQGSLDNHFDWLDHQLV